MQLSKDGLRRPARTIRRKGGSEVDVEGYLHDSGTAFCFRSSDTGSPCVVLLSKMASGIAQFAGAMAPVAQCSRAHCNVMRPVPRVSVLNGRRTCFGGSTAFSNVTVKATRRQIDTRCRAAVSLQHLSDLLYFLLYFPVDAKPACCIHVSNNTVLPLCRYLSSAMKPPTSQLRRFTTRSFRQSPFRSTRCVLCGG